MQILSFINTLVNSLPNETDYRDYTIVFPNRRAGLFFTRALSQRTKNQGVILLPTVTDINHFVEEKLKSTLKKADDTQLLIYLYKAYTLTNPTTDHKLSSFIELGTKILHDFNEIDKYLVNAADLFQNVNDLTGVTANLASEVSQFYRTLLAEKEDSPLLFHQRFSALWNNMYPLYTEYKNLLKTNNIAYEGMIFRELCETTDDSLFNEPHIIFAGFNILTESERKIIERYPNRQMIFDYNTVQRKDTDFDYKSIKTSDFHFNLPTSINAYPCMTSANQAITLNAILQELLETSTPEQIEQNTAIILADESLLTESLSNIPREIKNLNITMGYPLADTQIAILTNNLIRLQLSIKQETDGTLKLYHKPLTDVLMHPYIQLITDSASEFQKEMVRQNKIMVPLDDLKTLNNPTLFTRNSNPLDYLENIFSQLEERLKAFDDEETMSIDRQFISQYRQQLKNLQEYLETSQIQIDESETYTLIRRLTRSLKVQFHGEPLKGLQIMGLLECRLLDFDNIIFVGFNDNFVPGTTTLYNSIIPYSLRRPYGLPSFEITNSIYAYNFYRMLHRCSRLDLIYNTATNDKSKSEPSRFYNQLRYIYGCEINTPAVESNNCVIDDKTNLFTPYMSDTTQPIDLKQLSASAFKHFIACPLRFYYEYVLQLKQPDEMEESVSERLFGNLLHRAMELYYNETRVQTEHAPSLTDDAKRHLIDRVCEQSFSEEMHHAKHNRGYDIIAFNSLKTIVTRIIRFDEQHKVSNLATESKIYASDSLFNYKAIIDRIDIKEDGSLNVIDYKTSVDKDIANLDIMFDMDSARKIDQEVMQVLFYCYIMRLTEEYKEKRLTPHLFKAYSLAKEDAKELTPLKIRVEGKYIDIKEYNDIKEKFEEKLLAKLTELNSALQKPTLFNTKATNSKNCDYCPFADLCMHSH